MQIGAESEPPIILDEKHEEKVRSESEPAMIVENVERKDKEEEKKTVSQEIVIDSPDDNGSNGSDTTRETDTSSDVNVNPIFEGKKGWLLELNYDNADQVNYILKMISAYAKVILVKNKRVHLSWKR